MNELPRDETNVFKIRMCDGRMELIDGHKVIYTWADIRYHLDEFPWIRHEHLGPCVVSIEHWGVTQRSTYEEARDFAERKVKELGPC